MLSTRFDEFVEEVRSLTAEQQMMLREMLDDLLVQEDQKTREAALARELLQKGIIRGIPGSIQDLAPYKNRKRITVQGKPLSETIIEERR